MPHEGSTQTNYVAERAAEVTAFYEALGIPTQAAPRFDFIVFVARFRSALKASATFYGPTRDQRQHAGHGRRAETSNRAPEPANDAATSTTDTTAAVLPPVISSDSWPSTPRDAEIERSENIPLPTAAEPLLAFGGPTEEFGALDHAPSVPQPETVVAPVGNGWRSHLRRPRRTRPETRAGKALRWAKHGTILAAAGIAIGNVSEPLLAAIYGGQKTTRDALAPGSGIMVFGNGSRPLFARPPGAKASDPDRAHLGPEALASEKYVEAGLMLVDLEDARLRAAPYSFNGLMRIHGTDVIGIARAAVGQATGKAEGGSTIPVMTCSILLGTMVMNNGLIRNIKNKIREHWCAITVEAEAGGDPIKEAGQLLDNAPLVVGGKGSQFGPEIQGVGLASRLLFSRQFNELMDCQLAFLAAAVNKPFLVPGYSVESRDRSARQFAKTAARARLALEGWRHEHGQGLLAADETCLAALSGLLNRRYRNPQGDLHRAFGDAAEQVRAEAFALRAWRPEMDEVRAGFDPVANEAAMARVTAAACRIQDQRHLLRNICANDGPMNDVQVRVHAMDRDGLVIRSVSLGAGSTRSLNEKDDGSLPSRGSVLKGLLLPVLSDGEFCRYDYVGLVDSDAVQGLDHACRPGEALSPFFAVQRSLNQPFLFAAEHADQQALSSFTHELGLPKTGNLRDLVLGNHPPSTQVLMRDYATITDPGRVGHLPHFIVGAPSDPLDLRGRLTLADVLRVRTLLQAPTRPGGTVHALAARLAQAGYRVNLAKSGTSESGSGSDERGKHVIAELTDPTGRTLIVFAEIASSDAGALSRSHGLSSADLAEIILAALEM